MPVTDDTSGLAHLHPDDRQWMLDGIRSELRAVFEASAKGPAAAPPGRPPADFDGLDARQFDRFKQDMLRDLGDVVRAATAEFLPAEDIDERIAGVKETIGQRFETFKSSFLDEVRKVMAEENGKLRAEIFDIFDDLGMSLEKGEKRKATRERLGGLFAMHESSKEFKAEIWKQMRAAFIGWLVAAVGGFAAYIGLRGGPSH